MIKKKESIHQKTAIHLELLKTKELKEEIGKLKRTEIMHSVFSDHHRIKL
jgi:hypothetical protein